MWKFLRNLVPKGIKLNNDASGSVDSAASLAGMRRRIIIQVGLAVLTLVLTLVIIFGIAAAWYTNVVNTSSLVFTVEKWGVSLETKVNATAYGASPGDKGIVDFEVDNTGDAPVTVSVSATKFAMEAEMQKRLYFYVDTQHKANNEVMQRVYLNSLTAYDYEVFSQLTLTEDYHNDVPLKWCWVYDVLGYYVLAGENEEGVWTVQEYLRPIEYDYDDATFHPDGTLKTVDGTTDVSAFLQQLSATDGYSGTISGETVQGGYYPVEVNDSGYGVYAYLYSLSEIRAATAYDTALGNAAANGETATYTANFTIYAQNSNEDTLSVNTEQALVEALGDADTTRIQLTGDVTLSEAVTVAQEAEILLDLNGHTLSTALTSGTAVVMKEGSELAIMNGAIDGAGSDAFAITGGRVTASDVELTGFAKAFTVTDYAGTGRDGTVQLLNCTVDTTVCGVLIQGNGVLSEQISQVFIDGCTMTSDLYCIAGNGTLGNGTQKSPGRWGTSVQVSNSTLSAAGSAVYHPQPYGTLRVYNSTLTGYTAVAIKGGTVFITDSVINGTGTDVQEPVLTTSGYSDTGDAVYVETGYGYEIYVELNGRVTLTSVEGQKLRVFEETAPCVTVVDNRTAAE